MAGQKDGSDAPIYRIIIAPNQSLSALRLVGLYCGGVALSLTVATVLAWFGFWPILAYAAAEWLIVGACLWVVHRGGWYREHITVTAAEVNIEKRDLNRSNSISFKRHWASVESRATGSWHPSRLLIKSHGVVCEVGRCLTEEERRALAARLNELIGPVNRTPDLTIAKREL